MYIILDSMYLILWDKRVFQLIWVEEIRFTLSCGFRNCEDNFTWVFTGVYGPSKREYREDMWGEMGAIKGLWEDPWFLGGDLNVVKFPGERNRVGGLTGPMRRFSQVIDDLELKDLALRGGYFTWKGGLDNQRMARLDRFLVSEEWDNYFRGVIQSILPKPTSDHSPILLKGGGRLNRGPMPFRFENMWLQANGFHNLIAGWWANLEIRGTKSYVLMEK